MKRRLDWPTITLIGAAALFFIGGLSVLYFATLPIPDLHGFEQRKVLQSTKIYERTGDVLLYDVHESIQRTVIPFEQMSRHIKNATVAIEDAEFYQHAGVKPTAILRAAIANFLSGDLLGGQGGSTITQQVVKNAILTTDKSLTRKFKEWVLSLKLEQVASKEQILEAYLNETPYGGALYGIEEASHAFLGKSAADLTLPEAAYLAALPQRPTYFSPYGTHIDALESRKNLVLEKMLENGFITTAEYEEAKETAVEFKPQEDRGIKAPHFVFYVREYLENKYGERAVEERGFRVITTLDWKLQEKAEEIVNRYALENAEKFNAKNAALTAVDPKTGQILVMVGSRDYFDDDVDGAYNVAATYPGRQPGSAFKPFVYAEAIRKGYTSETAVFDVPTQFSTACPADNFTSEGECYSPKNYDNVFRGPVSFRNALAQSINVPAVKVLYLAGLSDALRLAKDLGISTLTNVSRYGLTLVLGGGEVTPLEMTSAYGVFANEGVRNPPVSILRIEDAQGNVVEEFEAHPTAVLEKDVALTISDMLSDNVARAPAFGENSYLYFPGRSVAAKTGTTNDYKDAWIVGYTPHIAVGAWAGNNDNSSMEKRVAGFIVAPMWNAFMKEALASMPEVAFPEPTYVDPATIKPILRGEWSGGTTQTIDIRTGQPATQDTPPEFRQTSTTGGGEIHSILHWIDRRDPTGPSPANPSSDAQYAYWETGIARWLTQNIPSLPSGTAH